MIRRTLGLALAAAMLVSLGTPAWAWDDFGHMEVAAVAYAGLNAKAKTRVAALLKLNPSYANWIVGAKKSDQNRVAFIRAATWADAIKEDQSYRDDKQTDATAARNIGYGDTFRHKYWHFVDQPFSPDGTPLVQPLTPNAATQIPLLRVALAAPGTSEPLRSYDLVWLLHLVGDVHQPLHCVSRYVASNTTGDRGGNTVKVKDNAQPPTCDDPRFCPFGPPPELHGFFDTIAGSGYAVAPVEAAAAKLPKPSAAKAAILDETAWFKEGLDLAQSAIYVTPIGIGDGPFTVGKAYQSAALKLGKQRIALAGARLARVINDALGK